MALAYIFSEQAIIGQISLEIAALDKTQLTSVSKTAH